MKSYRLPHDILPLTESRLRPVSQTYLRGDPLCTQITRPPWPTSIWRKSDAKTRDRCLIEITTIAFTIFVIYFGQIIVFNEPRHQTGHVMTIHYNGPFMPTATKYRARSVECGFTPGTQLTDTCLNGDKVNGVNHVHFYISLTTKKP